MTVLLLLLLIVQDQKPPPPTTTTTATTTTTTTATTTTQTAIPTDTSPKEKEVTGSAGGTTHPVVATDTAPKTTKAAVSGRKPENKGPQPPSGTGKGSSEETPPPSAPAPLPPQTAGSLAVFAKQTLLFVKPMPDGTFSLSPAGTATPEGLEAIFGPKTAIQDASGKLLLNWASLSPDVKGDVTAQVREFANASRIKKEEKKKEPVTLEGLSHQIDGLIADHQRLFVAAKVALMLLAIVGLLPAVFLWRQARNDGKRLHKITGTEVTSIEESLTNLSIKLSAVRATLYPDFADTADNPWNIEAWHRETVRKRQDIDGVVELLHEKGDSRSFLGFANDAITMLTGMHTVLFGRGNQADWNGVRDNLLELSEGKAGGVPLPESTSSAGLVAALRDVGALRKELEEKKGRDDRLQELARACRLELGQIDNEVEFEKTEDRVTLALRAIDFIKEKGGSDPLEWIRQAADDAEKLVETTRVLGEIKQSVEEEESRAAIEKGRTANLEKRLLLLSSQLSLPSLAQTDQEATITSATGLSGVAWTDHLDLLALKNEWSRLIADIPESLLTLLEFGAVPDELRDAIEHLRQIEVDGQEPANALWRIYDHLSHILEFLNDYRLTELAPIGPRLDLVRNQLKQRMKSLNCVCVRPQLFEEQPADFESDYEDVWLMSDTRIGDRIRRELVAQRTMFIVDIAQSAVYRNGKVIRRGHCHIVAPGHWR